MPLFRLSERIEFPPAWLARSDGLLCIGGDLSSERLLLAYKKGIFPWFSANEPLLWWSPDPRLVLFPSAIKVSRSLKKKINKNLFRLTLDQAFEQTINACARSRQASAEGTWLVDEMIDAYIKLHRLGHAHSIEVWLKNRLVGGLYGICLGGSFFGESMFSIETDASKIALVGLACHLTRHGFDLIDCQVTTGHLVTMGAIEISRETFLEKITISIARKMAPETWNPDLFHYPLPFKEEKNEYPLP